MFRIFVSEDSINLFLSVKQTQEMHDKSKKWPLEI